MINWPKSWIIQKRLMLVKAKIFVPFRITVRTVWGYTITRNMRLWCNIVRHECNHKQTVFGLNISPLDIQVLCISIFAKMLRRRCTIPSCKAQNRGGWIGELLHTFDFLHKTPAHPIHVRSSIVNLKFLISGSKTYHLQFLAFCKKVSKTSQNRIGLHKISNFPQLWK